MATETIELGKVLIIFKGAWIGGGSYVKLDVVTNRDSSYICILDAPSGITLDNTTYWRPLSLGAYDYAVAAGYTGTAAQFAIDLADVSTKISTSAIANNLTTTEEGKVLDARQGKVLNENKLDKSDVVNNLTTTDAGKALDARQGKVLYDTKEPNLPATPENPDIKFFNGLRQWAVMAIGAGGFSSPLYFTNVDSDISGYKKISNTADASVTELVASVTSSDGEKFLRAYAYDFPLATTVIDSGPWVSNFKVKVSNATGVTKLILKAYVRHTDNSETILFSAESSEINNISYEVLRNQSPQGVFSVLAADRLVVKIYAQTTSGAIITITTSIGDGDASYITTPLALRHNQLIDPNGDPNYLHVTTGAQTFAGVKTFSSSPIIPIPTTDYQGAPKKYVDDADALINTSINALKLADTKQQDSIQQIENTLNTININQEATATKEDYGTLALPKNAANGGMSVKLEGLTAENLVNGKNISPAGSVTFATINGNKYYVSNQAVLITGDGNNYTSTNSGSTTINIIVINLTTTFGSGSEPLIAVAAKMFPTYFDGVKHFVAQGRLRSVGKNLLNISPTNKKIYNGQADGMTTIQRLLYYDILMPITRTAIILGTITNYSIFSSKVEITSNNANYGIGFKVKAKAGETYNSSTTPTNGYIGVGIYNNIGTLLANYVISTGGTFTCPADTDFILIVFTPSTAGTNATFVNTQLSKGLVVNTYEPYTESALYLNSPALRSNGTTKDELRKGANGYELVQRISRVDNSILATPIVTPIAYGGLLNSNSNGTVYREKVIADAGVYSDKLSIQLTDYPISSFEQIIKRSNGVETILNNATAVIASGGLSFTHPDLVSGDLVLFTYYFANESTEGKTTLTYYDSRYVIADTANGKYYKHTISSTNGVPSIVLTEV